MGEYVPGVAWGRLVNGYPFYVKHVEGVSDSQPVDIASYELCSDMIDVVIDVSCIYGRNMEDDDGGVIAPAGAPPADSNCVITLNNGTVLVLREVNRSLALVCILKAQVLAQQGILEYNFRCFRDALGQLFQLPTPALAPELGALAIS